MNRFIGLGFCLLVTSIAINAQQLGGNRPFLQWKQINNDKVRVIFPGLLDSNAVRIAAIAQYLQQKTSPTIGNQHQKVDIVLQPYTTISNAYVSLGPYRSEFFMTPLQNSFELGTLPWTDNLAIHEFRHVQQYSNFNVGLSKVARIIFGQQGQNLFNALSVPNWFWEGDAVFQETLVSEQGRGRLSFFYNDYRSLWQANKNYSWMKLRNGSLVDFVPDHYRLGYLQVAYGRKQYGDDFWKKVTQDAAAFRGLFYPFQRAIRKYSGKKYYQFTSEAFSYHKSQYNNNQSPPVKTNRFIGNFEYPAYSSDNALIYVKQTYSQVPVFVVKKEGKPERKIRVKSVSIDNHFSYKNGQIVYSAYRPNIRWGWNDYSELQLLDASTGKQRTLTKKTKYFSPDISDNGKLVLAVDVQPNGKNSLHLVESDKGGLVKALPNKENYFYTYPKFINDKEAVAAVRDKKGLMALVRVNIEDGSIQNLTPFSWRIIGFPVVERDTVFFSASNGVNDGLYAIAISSGKIYNIKTSEKGIGAYQPAIGNRKLAYTSATAYGYLLNEENTSLLQWNEISQDDWTQVAAPVNASIEKSSSVKAVSAVSAPALPITNYSQSTRLFNFHSMLPLFEDPSYTLSVVGQNVLNTLESELYFTYNRNERSKQIGFNGVFAKWFPYIIGGVRYAFDRSRLYNRNTIRFNEAELLAGLRVPLNLSKGRNFTRVTFGSNFIYNSPSYRGRYKDTLKNQSFGYLSNTISFSNRSQQARQHIFPRFAQTLSLAYKTAVSNFTGRQININGSLYFPGVINNHHIVLNLAMASRDNLGKVNYSNLFPFARGYESVNLLRMRKAGINYHFPLAYPDAGVANLLYLLRIRANAFFDYTVGNVAFRVNNTNQIVRRDTDFRSTGAELYFDTKWWNELPISFGVRYSRLLDADLFGGKGNNRFEIILPVNLLQR